MSCKGGKGRRIVKQQGWRGWRAGTWQVGKGREGEGGGGRVVKRWEGGKGARVVRSQGRRMVK